MYKVPLADLKEKIIFSRKITPRDLEEKIKQKIAELSGLISEEGAAHIIANELGISLIEEKEKLKIKEIYAGMKNVTLQGKVVQKYDLREFAKGDKTGKVCSLLLGDETGTIRIVFWNDQVSLISAVKDDDILLIKEAYVKDNKGGKEVHFSGRSSLDINPEGVEISSVRKTALERKKIEGLSPGEERVEVFGTIVQVFDLRFFYICRSCNKRVNEMNGKLECSEHKGTIPELSYVLNAVIDDGTGNIRCVFWKNQTNNLLDKDEKEMAVYRDNMSGFEDAKNELLGEQFKLIGKINKNEMFARLEFSVQIVEKGQPEEELAKLETEEQV